MKLFHYAAVATIAYVATWNPASAQSTTDILQRLEALEKSNADLKKENAELRDRMRRIESGKQTASAKPAPVYVTATAPVYKATPVAVPAPWSWTGFYVGAHEDMRNNWRPRAAAPATTRISRRRAASAAFKWD